MVGRKSTQTRISRDNNRQDSPYNLFSSNSVSMKKRVGMHLLVASFSCFLYLFSLFFEWAINATCTGMPIHGFYANVWRDFNEMQIIFKKFRPGSCHTHWWESNVLRSMGIASNYHYCVVSSLGRGLSYFVLFLVELMKYAQNVRTYGQTSIQAYCYIDCTHAIHPPHCYLIAGLDITITLNEAHSIVLLICK